MLFEDSSEKDKRAAMEINNGIWHCINFDLFGII